jgi:hypothetical protein
LRKILKEVKRLFKPKDKYLMALERLLIYLDYFLKDKIHQNSPLEKFLKEDKRLFKQKVKYLES